MNSPNSSPIGYYRSSRWVSAARAYGCNMVSTASKTKPTQLIPPLRSVVSRTVQSSLWPTILRTDSVASRKVSFRVLILTWLITLSVGLLAIVGIVTPLGLTQSIRPARSLVQANFQYVPDLTAFGFGTAPRYNRFSRLCDGGFILQNCPGRDDGYEYTRNASGKSSYPNSSSTL
jgi:hypothetical protein